MRTHRIGHVHIDERRLAPELEAITQLPFSEAYSDYLCGGPWKSCMIWSLGGSAGDGFVTSYDHERRGSWTPHAAQLPYISELVESTFDLEHLNFVRVAVISNSVIIPHRDLLELTDKPADARNVHRIHVPLVTNDQCFFAQGDVVYRMRAGEVWSFDASRIHSAASFSEHARIHLLLDFRAVPDPSTLTKFGTPERDEIPLDSICERPDLTNEDRAALLSLAPVLDRDTYRDVFGIVIKKHFRKRGAEHGIWDTFVDIAARSGNDEILAKAEGLRRYFLIERSGDRKASAPAAGDDPQPTAEALASADEAVPLVERLNRNELRRQLVHHEFFRRVRHEPMTREQVAIFVGQWWHPLHYFTTFLARCVSVLPTIEAKCAVTKILNQEAGEGNPARAHEVVYVDTMAQAGLTRLQTTGMPAFPETAAVVDGYARASSHPLTALGFIFATEVADLAMVSGIGAAVAQATGIRDLEWVNIHVEQEPDHVNEAHHALLYDLSAEDEARLVRSAEEMWRLWIAFFDRLEKEAFLAFAVEHQVNGVVGV